MKFKTVIFACCVAMLTASSVIASNAYAQEAPQFPPEHEPLESPLEPDDVVPLRPMMKPDNQADPASPANKPDEVKPLVKKADELNSLFTTLKRTADAKEAEKISQQIQGLWSQSGSATVDLLMGWAEDAARNQDYAQAMDFLDNVVALDPTYAEGWMRRASVHIQMNDIALAVLELNKTLQYEPRQFNAMMQLGAIFEMTDRGGMALEIYTKALEIYPQMTKVQKRMIDLLEKSTDRAI